MGDAGVTVEFGRSVDPALHARVLALDAALADDPIAGVTETIPTYRSLLVLYDPTRLGWDALVAAIGERISAVGAVEATPRRWLVPACFGGVHGEDLALVAGLHGLSEAAAVAALCAAEYRVYMIGFVPGFTYLGGLPEALHTSRRQNPRLVVPAGSVSIGGIQAGICPIDMPSGWHLLGRTPVRLFDLARDPPCLFRAGDRLRFEPVDHDTYQALAAEAAGGEPIARLVA
jgi:KipI family sensor histidine kinase inhibitor